MERVRPVVGIVVAVGTMLLLAYDALDATFWGGHYEPPQMLFSVLIALIGSIFVPDAVKYIKGKNGNGNGKNGNGSDK